MNLNFNTARLLKREIASWHDENIISKEQAELLYERYNLLAEPPWYSRSGFIISAVALFIAGLGLLLLISENWHSLNLPLRALVGLVPLFASYAFGIYLHRQGKSSQSELAFFFGSIVFGANIFLQAQIFHISAYYPNGILWWAIGSLPFALYFRSALHGALVHVATAIWLLTITFHNHFSIWSIVLLGALTYLQYRTESKALFVLLVAIFSLCVAHVHYILITGSNILDTQSMMIVIAIVVMSAIHLMYQRYSESFRNRLYFLAQAFILTNILVITYYTDFHIDNVVMPIDLSVIFAGACVLMFFAERSGVTILSMGIVGLLLGLEWLNLFIEKGYFYDVYVVWANLALLATAIFFVVQGLRRKTKKLFMWGIGIFIIHAVSRYFDLFDDYLTTAVMFICSGGIILLLNRFWNKKYEA